MNFSVNKTEIKMPTANIGFAQAWQSAKVNNFTFLNICK